MSVCLSVCNVGGSVSHRLEMLETNWKLIAVSQPRYSASAVHVYLLGRHAQLTRCFSAVAELLVVVDSTARRLL